MSETLQPILDTALDAAVAMRSDGVVIGWNGVAEAIFGWSRDEALGRPLAELIVPPNLRDAHIQGLQRYKVTGQDVILGRRIEINALHKQGHLFQVELAITLTRARHHGQEVFLGFLRDISERKRAETALRQSEQRLKASYEHAFVGIAETDLSGRFVGMNAQLCKLTGYSEEELRGLTLLALTHPDDIEVDRSHYERLWRGELETYTLEKRVIRKDGDLVWFEVRASLVRDEAGEPLYGIRVVRDISEQKRSAAYQMLLMNELNHRVKNVMGILQSIARQTFKNAPAEQTEAFQGRVSALAAAHDVVFEGQLKSVGLKEIVLRVLGPFGIDAGDRFEVTGPDVLVPQKMGVTLSMAVHELATNATKYGALTRDEGRVKLTWSVQARDDGSHLNLLWVERGGPVVVKPTRTGFGSMLIEHALALEMNGNVRLDYRPEGLACSIGPYQSKA